MLRLWLLPLPRVSNWLMLLKRPGAMLCMLASTVPFIYAVSSLHTEKLATSPMLLLVPTAVFFFCALSAAVMKKSR